MRSKPVLLVDAGDRRSRESRCRLFRTAVLISGILLAACSHAPQEPAPVFALPLNRITGAPAAEGQNPPVTTARPAAPRLRYVAVPPGHKVSGMAHARIILKHAKASPHRTGHAHKTKVVRTERVSTAPKHEAKASASDAPAAMIPLDEPVTKPETAKP